MGFEQVNGNDLTYQGNSGRCVNRLQGGKEVSWEASEGAKVQERDQGHSAVDENW